MSRFALLFVLLLAACGGEPPEPAPAVTNDVVVASFEPARALAARIVGDLVPVTCPLPAGADPARWRPERDDVAAMQASRLVVVAGADFERWTRTASLPRSRTVELADGLSEPFLTYTTTTHTHGAGGEHTHEGTDGHTWVDPVGLGEMSAHLLDALVDAWPEHEDAFTANARALDAELDALHERYAALAPALRDATVLCSHQAYAYLARRYGFEVLDADHDPARSLDVDTLRALAEAKGPGVTLMLWEEEPVAGTHAALAELGIRSVIVAPGEHPDDGDLLDTLTANAARLEEVLR